MNLKEYLAYICGYVKACKLKKDVIDYPYITVAGNLLICLDGLGSTLYTIELEYTTNYTIATTLDVITNIVENGADESLCFNQHIYNIIYSVWYRINMGRSYRRITSRDEISDFSAKDDAERGIYFYDDNPTEEFIHYNFYNMVPISKSDIYYIDVAEDFITHTNIIRYTVFKKKPKCTIVIYRRALDLMEV